MRESTSDTIQSDRDGVVSKRLRGVSKWSGIVFGFEDPSEATQTLLYRLTIL